jgi:formyltetrahydrofolate synthetase
MIGKSPRKLERIWCGDLDAKAKALNALPAMIGNHMHRHETKLAKR